MRLTKKLLSLLNRVFDKDPARFLALRLSYDGGMSWLVQDGVLTTTVSGGSGSSQTIDVRAMTVAALAAMLGTLPGYSILYVDSTDLGQLSAKCLMDGRGDIGESNGDHVYGYTSVLWSYMDASASELTIAKTQIGEMLKQMSTTTGEGEWLDELGNFYVVPRKAGETDALYGPRIIATVLRPRGNNIAIAMAIEEISAGLKARIVDAVDIPITANFRDGSIQFNGSVKHVSGTSQVVRGLFDAQFEADFVGTNGFDGQRIADLINLFRDAGTYLRKISVTGAIVDSADSGAWGESLLSDTAIDGYVDTYTSVARRHDGTILRNGAAVYDSGSEDFTLVIS